jgi:hypothetical protein
MRNRTQLIAANTFSLLLSSGRSVLEHLGHSSPRKCDSSSSPIVIRVIENRFQKWRAPSHLLPASSLFSSRFNGQRSFNVVRRSTTRSSQTFTDRFASRAAKQAKLDQLARVVIFSRLDHVTRQHLFLSATQMRPILNPPSDTRTTINSNDTPKLVTFKQLVL